jgi:subfamily B ATP-binding cassette protein MsbA
MNYYRNWMKRVSVRALSGPLLELIGGFGTALLLWYGGSRVIQGDMTPGDFLSFITALSLLYSPIRKLNKVNIEIQEGIAASRRIFELMDTPPEITESRGPSSWPGPRGLRAQGRVVQLHE